MKPPTTCSFGMVGMLKNYLVEEQQIFLKLVWLGFCVIDDGWIFGNDDGVQSEELRLMKST